MASKSKCQQSHARRRLKERYGLDGRAYLAIDGFFRHALKHGLVSLVEKQSNRVKVYDLRFRTNNKVSI